MTKHILTIILLAAIGCFSTSAGKLFGRINGSDGNPVPYAAIYFEELKTKISDSVNRVKSLFKLDEYNIDDLEICSTHNQDSAMFWQIFD